MRKWEVNTRNFLSFSVPKVIMAKQEQIRWKADSSTLALGNNSTLLFPRRLISLNEWKINIGLSGSLSHLTASSFPFFARVSAVCRAPAWASACVNAYEIALEQELVSVCVCVNFAIHEKIPIQTTLNFVASLDEQNILTNSVKCGININLGVSLPTLPESGKIC